MARYPARAQSCLQVADQPRSGPVFLGIVTRPHPSVERNLTRFGHLPYAFRSGCPYHPSMTNRWPHTGAFVLQFPADAGPEAGLFEGRVEHVASGRTARFRTPKELWTFVAQVLADLRAGN